MSFEIIIPFYNEFSRLDSAVQVLAEEFKKRAAAPDRPSVRFWWADDGSTDGSREALKQAIENHPFPGAEHVFLRREHNQGKGSIMRYAIDNLREKLEPESIISFWDSDGELYPDALFKAYDMVHKGEADIVFGSRFIGTQTSDLGHHHYLGNRALTTFSNFLSGLTLSDVHCCFRTTKAKLLFELPFTSNGFDFEAEFAALVGRVQKPKLRIKEIPVIYKPRTAAEGKKINAAHVLPQVRQALRCRFLQSPIKLNS